MTLGDAATLADRLAHLYLDEPLNRAMGQRARITIEQRYAEEVAGKVFLDVWDRLLRKVGKA